MGRLTIEDLPDELLARLERKAAQTGRSIGDIAREALMTSVGEEVLHPAQARIRQLYGGQAPGGVTDAFLGNRKRDWGEE